MLTAKDIMVTDVVTIKPTASVAEARELMQESCLRDLIVEPAEPGDAYGILTETDIVYKVVATGLDVHNTPVSEIMTKPCIVVNPDLAIEYVAKLFANTHLHRAPVIREKLLGVISVSDMIHRTMWWQGRTDAETPGSLGIDEDSSTW
jgi:CBS domain-containing protein